MTAVASKSTRVLLGDFSLSSKLNQVSLPWNCDMLDVTTLADADKNLIPGQDTSTFTMSGFYDTAVDTDVQAWTINTEQALTLFPFGDAVGSHCAITSAFRPTFDRGVQVAGVVAFDLQTQTNGSTDYGLSLHALGAETATSTGTTIDNSASTANGAIGSLHVTAFTGFTSVTVDIRHSTDNFSGSNTSLIAFAAATGTTSEIKAATGTVNRYVRVIWTVSGTGSITFAVGFARR